MHTVKVTTGQQTWVQIELITKLISYEWKGKENFSDASNLETFFSQWKASFELSAKLFSKSQNYWEQQLTINLVTAENPATSGHYSVLVAALFEEWDITIHATHMQIMHLSIILKNNIEILTPHPWDRMGIWLHVISKGDKPPPNWGTWTGKPHPHRVN